MLRMLVAGLFVGMAWWIGGIDRGAAQEKKTEAPITKSTDEKLPPRALNRFGTSKFRHGSRILCLAYSPDGRILAAGGGDDPVRLWDVDTGTLLRTLPEAWVNAIVFSTSGSVVATAGAFKTIRVWETATGKEINKLQGHKSAVKSLALSPNGHLLAAGDTEGTIIVWSFELGFSRVVTTFKGHTDEITSLAFSLSNKTLVSGSADRTVRLWDVDDGKLLRQVDARCLVGAVAFTDDKTLVSAGDDHQLRIWDVDAGKQTDVWKGHEGNVVSLLVHRENKTDRPLTLVSGAHDGTIRLWSLTDKTEPRVVQRALGDSDALAITRNGDFLATAGVNNTVRMFEAGSLKELTFGSGHQAGVHSLALSPNGKMLASASVMGDIRVWEPESGRVLSTWKGPTGGEVFLAFSPDSDTLASAAGTDAIRVWDPKEGKERFNLPAPQGDPTLSLAFSSDGQTLIAGRYSGKVEVWNLDQKKTTRDFRYKGPAYALAVSRDGKLLAVSGSNKVTVWNLDDGRELRTFATRTEGPEEAWPTVAALAFHPEGKIVALACYDGVIRLMDVHDGTETKACEGHASVPYGIAFSRDGKTLASASFDRTVRLWEAFSGRTIAQMKGHNGPATAVAFANDGRAFYSASADTTILRWDATGTGGTVPVLKLSVPEMTDMWTTLASEDTPRAHAALWRFVGGGKEAVDFMESGLYLVDPKKVDQLFEDLKSEVYKVREKATAELEKYGRWMEGRLRESLKKPDSLEVQRRLERLLGKLSVAGSLTLNQERLRSRRVMMILGQIGDEHSQRVLEKMARGSAEPALQYEAQAALERMNGKAVSHR